MCWVSKPFAEGFTATRVSAVVPRPPWHQFALHVSCGFVRSPFVGFVRIRPFDVVDMQWRTWAAMQYVRVWLRLPNSADPCAICCLSTDVSLLLWHWVSGEYGGVALLSAFLADEPSSGLDPGHRESLFVLLRLMRPHCCMLVSTQHTDDAEAVVSTGVQLVAACLLWLPMHTGTPVRPRLGIFRPGACKSGEVLLSGGAAGSGCMNLARVYICISLHADASALLCVT